MNQTGSDEARIEPGTGSSGGMNLPLRCGPSRIGMTYGISRSVQLPLRVAYPFAEAHSLARRAREIRELEPPSGVHESVFRRAVMAEALRDHGILDTFIRQYWPNGATAGGQALLASYRRLLQRLVSPDARRAPLPTPPTPTGPPEHSADLTPSRQASPGQTDGLLAFVRGMGIYKTRRVSKRDQERLLRLHLCPEITFLGTFDKSGNYALRSGLTHEEVAEAVTEALRQDQRLRDLDLSHVRVLSSEAVHAALDGLIRSVAALHGNLFDSGSFGVHSNSSVWRAGLTFLPEAASVGAFTWPADADPKVSILASSGQIIQFLKREENKDQERITFGDPTSAVEAALEALLRRTVTSTSRSGRTVRGVLRLLS